MYYKEALERKIKEITEKWERSNIYYVGGYVRDGLIEKYFPEEIQEIKDVDLVIDLENGAEEFVKFLKSEYPDNCTGFAEYPRFGTAKFTLHFDGMIKADGSPWIREQEIECVSPRSEEYSDGPRKPSSVRHASIKEDAMRRDFCCNAVYKNVVTGDILDPTGRGVEDIKNKILRTPLDPKITYKDDPLRMLRVIRFAAKKGFAIEEKTFKAISPIPEYYKLSMERVNSEFSQIMMSSDPVKYIWMLHDTGLLKYIIPEFEEAWGFNQNSKYHSLNLTDHCLEVLNKVSRTSTRPRKLQLRLAALLHDISKYKIHETSADGTFSYHGHEIDSSNMARDILTRLKYSNDEVNRVCFLIENHMRIKSQYDYNTKQYTGTKKSMGKLIRTIDSVFTGQDRVDVLESLMLLIDADNLSHSPKWNMPDQVKTFYDKYNKWFLGLQNIATTKPIVSGKDIMDRFKIAPGKTIGYIKDEIILGFQLDHPKYDKTMLLDMYEAEFGGKNIYIWKSRWKSVAPQLYMSVVKPTLTQPGNYYSVNDYRDEIEMDADEGKQYIKDVEQAGGLLVLDAIHYPELLIRCRIRKRSKEILDKVWETLSELQDMPGFEKVTLDLDNCNDVSARIDWSGHRSDYII